MSGRLERIQRHPRSIVSCAAAFNTLEAAALLLLAALQVVLNVFGVKIPNLFDALRQDAGSPRAT